MPVAACARIRRSSSTNPVRSSRRRLGEGPLTELSDDEMARVEESLLAVLGVIVA